MDFSTIQAITIPEGPVSQITGPNGEVLWSGLKEFVVADGTVTLGYTPFYFYYGNANQNVNWVYPEEWLTKMVGKTIKSFILYFTNTNPGSNNWGTCNLYMQSNYTSNTISSFIPVDGNDTLVWTGKLAGSEHSTFDTTTKECKTILDTPYHYTGGNLLIKNVYTKSGWKTANVYGTSGLYTPCNFNSYNNRDSSKLPKIKFEF